MFQCNWMIWTKKHLIALWGIFNKLYLVIFITQIMFYLLYLIAWLIDW